MMLTVLVGFANKTAASHVGFATRQQPSTLCEADCLSQPTGQKVSATCNGIEWAADLLRQWGLSAVLHCRVRRCCVLDNLASAVSATIALPPGRQNL